MIALRWLYLGLVLATTASATTRLFNVLRVDGLDAAESAYLLLFAILFTWISASFWLACIGAYARWRGLSAGTLIHPTQGDRQFGGSASRTALLFPVRNEEASRLFAGISAVCDSIRERGAHDHFDVFILSDSNDPDCVAQEQQGWRDLRREIGQGIYYRHRTDNIGKKSGNIAQFCRNWGRLYDYMVVLDADSLMTGETLVSLVRLMDLNPKSALIQVSPQLVGQDSLFARIQQFASSVYGPIYTAGLALLQGPGGNYWGHNAIIRVAAFMQNCGLPKLPGRAPLGGEIMSHDFVEAALLLRAGWEVHLVTTLDGSYEEPPTTLLDHLARDRRWCQGNLQHLRLIFAQGFRTESRGHFLAGVMSYVSSPLWLALILASIAMMLDPVHVEPVTYFGRYPLIAWPVSHTTDLLALLGETAGLLYGPKLLGLLLVLRGQETRRAHGGGWKAVVSVALESLFSTLLAPIAMLSQSGFVVRILLGETKGWGVQRRDAGGLGWRLIARVFAVHTLIAVIGCIVVYLLLPGCIWWFVLLFAGPAMAIPFVSLTSSTAVGRWTSRHGLFMTAEDAGRIEIVKRVKLSLSRA
ncbi:MAG: glucans biosynthesis glucosyltransferase MdoH [Alphaproteobacteria bacterium]|nr:glucans biosynthesis glucosyltransferase MdoH [Alphaproteobacteria bacterium]